MPNTKKYKLTAEVILVSNALNSGDEKFFSSSVKFSCKLNPKEILGSGGGAGVVVGTVVGTQIVMINEGVEVSPTAWELP